MWCVDEVFDKKINNTLNFTKPSKKEAEQYINDHIKRFNEQLNYVENNPEIDEDKLQQIIGSIKEAARKWKESDVDINNERFTEVQHFVRTMPHKFPKEYILKNYKLSYLSLGADMVEALKFCFRSVLPSFFMMQKATAFYRIAYKYVGEALQKLSMNNDYVILSLGFDSNNYFVINGKSYPEAICKEGIWNFNGAIIHEMLGYGESTLIIINKNDVPMADLVKNETDNSVDLITDSMPIYSNIERVDKNTYMNVFYRIFIDVHYPADMKFIRITIPNIYSDNKYDLDIVQSIDKLLGN